MATNHAINAILKKKQKKKAKKSLGKIFLTVEETIFLMEWLNIDDANKAVDRFAEIMIEEKLDPQDMKKYLQKIMKRLEQ